jgi:hypothetical protein
MTKSMQQNTSSDAKFRSAAEEILDCLKQEGS